MRIQRPSSPTRRSLLPATVGCESDGPHAHPAAPLSPLSSKWARTHLLLPHAFFSTRPPLAPGSSSNPAVISSLFSRADVRVQTPAPRRSRSRPLPLVRVRKHRIAPSPPPLPRARSPPPVLLRPYKSTPRVPLFTPTPAPPPTPPPSPSFGRNSSSLVAGRSFFRRRLRRRHRRRILAAATIGIAVFARTPCARYLRRSVTGTPPPPQPQLHRRFFLAAGRLRRRHVEWVSAPCPPFSPLDIARLAARRRAL